MPCSLPYRSPAHSESRTTLVQWDERAKEALREGRAQPQTRTLLAVGPGLEARGTKAMQTHLRHRASPSAPAWPTITAGKQICRLAAACAPPARPWRGPGSEARAASLRGAFKAPELWDDFSDKGGKHSRKKGEQLGVLKYGRYGTSLSYLWLGGSHVCISKSLALPATRARCARGGSVELSSTDPGRAPAVSYKVSYADHFTTSKL